MAEPVSMAGTVRDLGALRALREVGARGSIAAAADALGVTQQALSARLRTPVTLAELAATPLVMREAGSGTRDTLTDHLAACDPPLTATPAIELGTSAAVRSAISAGVGPGVISRLAVRDDLVLGRLVAVEIGGPPLTRALTAVWPPAHGTLPPEAQRLLSLAKSGPSRRP